MARSASPPRPWPRSDGIEGHPPGMSLHRQGGSAHGGASRRGERHGVARHRRVEGQAGLRCSWPMRAAALWGGRAFPNDAGGTARAASWASRCLRCGRGRHARDPRGHRGLPRAGSPPARGARDAGVGRQPGAGAQLRQGFWVSSARPTGSTRGSWPATASWCARRLGSPRPRPSPTSRRLLARLDDVEADLRREESRLEQARTRCVPRRC